LRKAVIETGQAARGRNEDAGSRIVQDIAQFLDLRGRVDHQEDRARLEDGENGQYGLDTVIKKDRYPVAALDAGGDEGMSQAVGVDVDIGVGQTARAAHQGDLVWAVCGTAFEEGFELHDGSSSGGMR